MNDALKKYIQNTRQNGASDEAIADSLRSAGWSQSIIDESLRPGSTHASSLRWVGVPGIVLGYLWLVSGVDKILNPDFVQTFGSYTNSLINNGRAFGIFQSILKNIVAPNAVLMGNVIQYTEALIGLALLFGSIWCFFKPSRPNQLVLLFSFLASTLLVLNFICTLGLTFPFVDPNNAFIAGVSLDYVVLFLSALMSVAHFQIAKEIK